MAINRRRLGQLVATMMAMLLLAFLWVLFASLQSGHDVDLKEDTYAGIVEGNTTLIRVAGKRVWATRLSPNQLAQMESLSASVSDNASCQGNAELCIIDAATQRVGVELRFSAKPPAVLPSAELWFGGFINPANGAVYDLLGRAYLYQGEVGELNIISSD